MKLKVKTLVVLIVVAGIFMAGFLTGGHAAYEQVLRDSATYGVTYDDLKPGTYLAVRVVNEPCSTALVQEVVLDGSRKPDPRARVVRNVPNSVTEGRQFRINSIPYPGH